MADKTINQQTEDTTPTSDDYILTWDAATGTTKKVTLSNIKNSIMLSKSYKFGVYRAAAASTGSGTFLSLAFDTKEFDTSTNYSTATGLFTAPAAGFYQFNWSIDGSATSTAWIASLFKNGAEFKRGGDIREASQVAGSAGSAYIQMAAGDTANIGIFGNTSLAIGVGQATCWYNGFIDCLT